MSEAPKSETLRLAADIASSVLVQLYDHSDDVSVSLYGTADGVGVSVTAYFRGMEDGIFHRREIPHAETERLNDAELHNRGGYIAALIIGAILKEAKGAV